MIETSREMQQAGRASNNHTVLLGFEAKEATSPRIATVDAFVWPKDEARSNALILGGAIETALELLMCEAKPAEAAGSPILALLASSADLPNWLQVGEGSRWAVPPFAASTLVDRGWKYLGINLVEIDGLFSVHGIDGLAARLSISTHQLLQVSINEAMVIATRASALVLDHAPFVPIQVFCFAPQSR